VDSSWFFNKFTGLEADLGTPIVISDLVAGDFQWDKKTAGRIGADSPGL